MAKGIVGKVQRGASDAMDVKTATTFFILLLLSLFYLQSDLPGARRIREFTGIRTSG